jgi:hypothetical protein
MSFDSELPKQTNHNGLLKRLVCSDIFIVPTLCWNQSS